MKQLIIDRALNASMIGNYWMTASRDPELAQLLYDISDELWAFVWRI